MIGHHCVSMHNAHMPARNSMYYTYHNTRNPGLFQPNRAKSSSIQFPVEAQEFLPVG